MKFHIKKDFTIANCEASENPCPLQSAHFFSEDEAEDYVARMSTMLYNKIHTIKKGKAAKMTTVNKSLNFDSGNIAMPFLTDDISSFLEEFEKTVGTERAQMLRGNVTQRYVDGFLRSIKKAERENITESDLRAFRSGVENKYHMTTVIASDLRRKAKESSFNASSLVGGDEHEVKLVGIGSVSEEFECQPNEVFYIVCESESIDKMLVENDLPSRDLHITLGFDLRDIHNASKGSETLLKSAK